MTYYRIMSMKREKFHKHNLISFIFIWEICVFTWKFPKQNSHKSPSGKFRKFLAYVNRKISLFIELSYYLRFSICELSTCYLMLMQQNLVLFVFSLTLFFTSLIITQKSKLLNLLKQKKKVKNTKQNKTVAK